MHGALPLPHFSLLAAYLVLGLQPWGALHVKDRNEVVVLDATLVLLWCYFGLACIRTGAVLPHL